MQVGDWHTANRCRGEPSAGWRGRVYGPDPPGAPPTAIVLGRAGLHRPGAVFYRGGVDAVVEAETGDGVNWSLVAVGVVGLVFLISLIGMLSWLTSLSGWSTNYGPTGTFVNDDNCRTIPLRVAARVECRGEFAPADGDGPVVTTLIGPEAAFGSSPPVPGERVEVYHRSADTTRVFPASGRTTEYVRFLVGGLATVFLTIAAGSWLLGWFLTRGVSDADAEWRRERYRFPQRFDLQSKALTWGAVGVGWWLVQRLLLDDLLGTVGLG